MGSQRDRHDIVTEQQQKQWDHDDCLDSPSSQTHGHLILEENQGSVCKDGGV